MFELLLLKWTSGAWGTTLQVRGDGTVVMYYVYAGRAILVILLMCLVSGSWRNEGESPRLAYLHGLFVDYVWRTLSGPGSCVGGEARSQASTHSTRKLLVGQSSRLEPHLLVDWPSEDSGGEPMHSQVQGLWIAQGMG